MTFHFLNRTTHVDDGFINLWLIYGVIRRVKIVVYPKLSKSESQILKIFIHSKMFPIDVKTINHCPLYVNAFSQSIDTMQSTNHYNTYSITIESINNYQLIFQHDNLDQKSHHTISHSPNITYIR